MTNYSHTTCHRNIIDIISQDFQNIAKSKNLNLLDGKCKNKDDYLMAISKDENIMKHIIKRKKVL